MKSESLNRYYHTNAQRYANPHDIIGHYTAGARLIGLTQRQIRRDIKNLTKITSASDSTSPYAQPLVTSLDTFFDEQSQSKKLKQRAIRQKVRYTFNPRPNSFDLSLNSARNFSINASRDFSRHI